MVSKMILFIGVAGAGKSVQGRHLSEALGCPWISTGELLRMHIGGEKRSRMLQGELLTDKELYDVLQPVLISMANSPQIILDGFPRTQPQAEWLYKFSNSNNMAISCVIHMKADEGVVVERLLKRGRPDDTKQAIEKRFTEYKEVTLPILSYFKQLEVPCIATDGNDNEEKVRKNILQAVNKLGITSHDAKNNN